MKKQKSLGTKEHTVRERQEEVEKTEGLTIGKRNGVLGDVKDLVWLTPKDRRECSGQGQESRKDHDNGQDRGAAKLRHLAGLDRFE